MRNKITIITSLILVLALAVSAFTLLPKGDIALANDVITQRIVTVNGEGKIVVTPDLALIDLGVQTQNADATMAQQVNAKKMALIIEAIKKQGISAENIQTTSYNLYQNYNYDDNGKPSDSYYVASNIVNVKIDAIDKVGAIIDVATEAGANSINNIRFTVKDDSKYYAEALKLAMASAKEKATAVMATFGKTPSLPLAVQETSYGGRVYYDYAPTYKMEASTPIESGQITITANVSVQYDY